MSVFQVDGKWYFSVELGEDDIETTYWDNNFDLEWIPQNVAEISFKSREEAISSAEVFVDMLIDDREKEKE